MKDKYALSVVDNEGVLRSSYSEFLLRGLKLEGISVDFADLHTMVHGFGPKNLNSGEILISYCLLKSLKFLCSSHFSRFDFEYVLEIANYVFGIEPEVSSGVAIESVVFDFELLWEAEGSVTDLALMVAVFLLKNQIFSRHNEVIAMFAASSILVSGGAGVMFVPAKKCDIFFELLQSFRYSGDEVDLVNFLYEDCIDCGLQLIEPIK